MRPEQKLSQSFKYSFEFLDPQMTLGHCLRSCAPPSLPNLLSFRSAHNRSLEQLLLPDYLGCAGSQAMAKCHSRIEEFEALLENL